MTFETTAILSSPSSAAAEETCARIWADVCVILRRELGDAVFHSWIAPLAPSQTGPSVTLAAPGRLGRDWVRARYADRIGKLWAQISGTAVRVEVAVNTAPAAAPFSAMPSPDAAQSAAANDILSSPLDPRLTFDAFVEGPCNALALAAARRLVEEGRTAFNPLVLCGGTGLGKTHVLQAVAWELRRGATPARQVVYLSAERFMHRFVQALRARDTAAFKTALRGADVLLIDDFQFIAGKAATQEEFFHTFNALAEEGRAVVLASSVPPARLDGVEERLRSRLSGGLVVSLQAPDAAHRRRIVERKAMQLRHDIPPALCDLVAARAGASVRELEGALHRLVAQADMLGRAPTGAEAEALLADVLSAPLRTPTLEEIRRAVAVHYGLTPEDLCSARRARAVSRPRQIAMLLAKTLTDRSLVDIGRAFGGRDHTTVLYAVRGLEGKIAQAPALREDVDSLRRALLAGLSAG